MDKATAGQPAIGPSRPFTQGRCFDILRPANPPGSSAEARIISSHVMAVLTHWDPEHRTRLNHYEQACPNCVRFNAGPRWYGYLAVTRGERYGIEIAEITAHAGLKCRLINDGVENLRGRGIKLIRGKAKRVYCEITPATVADHGYLPPPIDLYGALCRLFQFRPLIAGTPSTNGRE